MAGVIHKLNQKKNNSWLFHLFWVLPALFLLVFYFYPILRVVQRSFIEEGRISVLNTANLKTGWRAIQFSFKQALLSTLATLLLGFPAAYLFGRFRFPGRKLLRLLSTLPFILPTVVVAAGFNALLGMNGWINNILMRLFDLSEAPIQMFGTLGAIILAHVFYNTSIFIRIAGTAWERLDRNIEDAARVLSASPWQSLRKVTLPLLMPSIISATLLVFLFDFTSFGVILLMGGAQFATIEVEIYIQTTQFLNLRLAGMLSLLQLVFSMSITALGRRIDKMSFTPVIPVVDEGNLRKPDNLWKRVFIPIMVFMLVAVMVVPVLALVLRALMVPPGENAADGLRLSLRNFQRIFINQRDALFFVPPFIALRNSILFASTATMLAVVLGGFIAITTRWSKKIGDVLDTLIMLPLGTSAVTLGLGYLLAFSGSRTLIKYYPLLIPIAHALIALPFVVRILQPAIQSIPEQQHYAAVMLGVAPRKLWWKVDVPMIKKPLITSAIYAFAISLGEFGATTFLSRPEIPTLPVAIFRYLGLPGMENYGKAMAMAVILLCACAAGFIFIENLQETQENQ